MVQKFLSFQLVFGLLIHHWEDILRGCIHHQFQDRIFCLSCVLLTHLHFIQAHIPMWGLREFQLIVGFVLLCNRNLLSPNRILCSHFYLYDPRLTDKLFHQEFDLRYQNSFKLFLNFYFYLLFPIIISVSKIYKLFHKIWKFLQLKLIFLRQQVQRLKFLEVSSLKYFYI